MSRWVVLPAVVTCALAAVLFGRFLTEDRELVAAVPSPRPVFQVSLIRVPPGEQLCISDVTIPEDARQLRVQVGTFGRPGPELDFTLRAPGYSDRVRVPAGYPDSALITAAMDPPTTARLGDVCVTHRGAAPIALVGTEEARTVSRPEGDVGGKVAEGDTYLAFYERGWASALDRAGEIVNRMSAFRPAVVGPWLLWPLLALVVLGVPAGVLWAALAAVRS
jgi:hypothetical protein